MDDVQLIHQRGFRVTPQRQLILDVIRRGGGHLTVEQIYRRVRESYPTIHLATVYRNLNFLCELRLIVAADIGGSTWVYEIAGISPHHHLVCRKCGHVEQITHEEVVHLIQNLQEKYQFQLDMDHMALFGLCETCQKEKSKGE